jgi:hypothetical protein
MDMIKKKGREFANHACKWKRDGFRLVYIFLSTVENNIKGENRIGHKDDQDLLWSVKA